MIRAARASNLTTGEDAKPWHIKVSYTMYEENGGIKDQGTIEKYWASPNESKLITTGKDFTQTVFETNDGPFRSGKQEKLLGMYHDAIEEMTEPMPTPEVISKTNFTVQERVNGTAKLSCLLPSEGNSGLHTAYCLSGSPAIARIVIFDGGNGLQAMRNRIQPYQDRLIAGDVIFRQQGKTLLTAHLESIEPLASVDEALFTPSDDAVLLILSSKTPTEVIKRVPPVYPPIAHTAHVQGLVVIQARIGKDGKPVDLKAIAGPDMLRQAALDAVREWRYRPYLIHGKPVEFIANAAFSFDGKGFVDPNHAPPSPQPPSPYNNCSLTLNNCQMQTTRTGNTIYITVPR